MQQTRKKFYVKSGQLEMVVLAETPELSCLEALDKAKDMTQICPRYFNVDERGFRCVSPQWRFETDDVIADFINEE